MTRRTPITSLAAAAAIPLTALAVGCGSSGGAAGNQASGQTSSMGGGGGGY